MEAGAYYTELTHYTVLTYGGKRGSHLVVVLGCIHRYRIWNDHLTGECRLSARAAGDFKHVSIVTRSKTPKRDKRHQKHTFLLLCLAPLVFSDLVAKHHAYNLWRPMAKCVLDDIFNGRFLIDFIEL